MGLSSFVLDEAEPLLYLNLSSNLVTEELNNKEEEFGGGSDSEVVRELPSA